MDADHEIDPILMAQAKAITQLPSRRAVIEEALRRMVEADGKEGGLRERQREALRQLRGSVPDWNDGRFDEGEDPQDW